jgi:Ca-activated chloride channel family protein
MAEKIFRSKHIRKQLESLYQKEYKHLVKQEKPNNKYRGLGLNWRDVVIFILALFFVGMYQVQAHAQNYFDLNDIDTSMMLSYHETENNYGALNLLSSQYDIDISGIIANVKITQTFQNNTQDWIKEAIYAFPVAKNAAVYQMKLIIGKRVIEGEIHEIKQAQKIYDDAKSQGFTASIIKQHRPNLFTTDVSNIMPNEKVTVEISYQQTLVYEAGHIDFRLPLAIKNRYMQDRFLAGLKSAATIDSDLQVTALPINSLNDNQQRQIRVSLEAGFTLSELKSLNHNVTITPKNSHQLIVLNDNQLYDKNDFVLRWYPEQDNEPQAALFSEHLNGEEYVLMMLLPPKNTLKNTQKREVVFIVDTSGSMQGAAMDAAKDALLFGLTQIDYQDSFNIIEFNSSASTLFEKSQLASLDNIDQAIDFISALNADGGTNMGPALTLSMKDEVIDDHLKQIIFMTDGSVGNEAQLFKQIKNDIGQARLFTLAIGPAPNNYFMNKAALIGKGTYSNISNLAQVDTEMNELFVKLSSPALTDVIVEWGENADQNPRIIPDLYSDQPVVVTAKMSDFKKDISLSGFADKITWAETFSLNKDGLSKGVAKLWARNQIEDLTDDYMLGSYENDTILFTLQEQITNIALKYHLASQFTSLVAVDKTPDMSRLVAIQAKSMTVQEEILAEASYPQGSLGWKWQMLFGLILISIAFFMRKKEV